MTVATCLGWYVVDAPDGLDDGIYPINSFTKALKALPKGEVPTFKGSTLRMKSKAKIKLDKVTEGYFSPSQMPHGEQILPSFDVNVKDLKQDLDVLGVVLKDCKNTASEFLFFVDGFIYVGGIAAVCRVNSFMLEEGEDGEMIPSKKISRALNAKSVDVLSAFLKNLKDDDYVSL